VCEGYCCMIPACAEVLWYARSLAWKGVTRKDSRGVCRLRSRGCGLACTGHRITASLVPRDDGQQR
jgi:hypothetical protein